MTARDSVGPWRKSTYSSANGDCVEVADSGGGDGFGLAVRDSKRPGGRVLAFAAPQWSAFLALATTTKPGR
ncbi:DUF397 domain-containing protein [Streptomyces sp. RFCAC02]|uniref:DUF397 domain-containing protein n=1 Tax=Streptomyces sp. RFCAC02 TaxID=2499143 RepID=UPI00102174E4|nr:DUF397 domain-containing protein [Streptomyces sp. RFCAC02]